MKTTLKPMLTRRDYIELFLFMSPEEIISIFPEGTTASKPTIYRLVQDHYNGEKNKMAQELKDLMVSYCPVETSLEDFEKDVDIWIAMARAEVVAKIHKRLEREAEAGLYN